MAVVFGFEVSRRICEMARAKCIPIGFRFDSSCKFIHIFLLQKADFLYEFLVKLVFGAAYFIEPTNTIEIRLRVFQFEAKIVLFSNRSRK